MFLKKELSKSTLYHRLGKIYRSSMLKGSVSKIDKIITVSEFSKQDIIEELKIESDKVIAILESYNSFFGEEVTVEKKPELPFVLALGAADERKNVAGIVKAFAAIAEETNANLLIVGYSNWETSKVYGTVKQLGIENRVKFSGFVSDEALRDLYHRAACFALSLIHI